MVSSTAKKNEKTNAQTTKNGKEGEEALMAQRKSSGRTGAFVFGR
jgi:hypothetical protein